MTHQQLKRAVICSFMWSLATELNKTVGDDFELPIMQKLAAMQSVAALVRIMLKECRRNDAAIVEPIKMAAWDELAELYRKEEVIANIPTMIEALYYNNVEWMEKIPNLARNIHIMARLAIDDDVKPKVSRIVTDEYERILSRHVYEWIKDQK